MDILSLSRRLAHPVRLAGPIIEARLMGGKIGDVCEIYPHIESRTPVAQAQIIGFHDDIKVLSLMGVAQGLSSEAVIRSTGKRLEMALELSMSGSVLDPAGKVIQRLCEETRAMESAPEVRTVENQAPAWHLRKGIDTPFATGIRVIDGLLTCGIGQRMGIFASAGCGKTMLMQMLINNAEADIFVIALIGERGREVTELVETLKQSGRQDHCIIISATSDTSALDRANAAQVATTVAEYYRDQGSRVVLFLDSITRYARALRDVALAAGEAPARRGYPASVFEALPRILERPGNMSVGSITAFYTILLESEDEGDPIADEIRSILDGHIYLSRKLAAKNHYPAIDVLRSVSRVSSQVMTREHQHCNAEIRRLMAKAEEMQLLIELGEYKSGMNADSDRAVRQQQPIARWLCQQAHEKSLFSATIEGMNELAQ